MKPDQRPAIGVIVLSAGKSSRMGTNKLLLRWGSTTVIENVADLAKSIDVSEVIFVTGYQSNVVEPILSRHQMKFVRNADFESGIHSSIQAGIKALSSNIDGFMIMLGDQPGLDKTALRDFFSVVKERFLEYGLFAPFNKGRRGHPVVINMKYKDEVLSTEGGDRGCHYLFSKYSSEVLEVPTGSQSILKDMDTLADYQQLSGNVNGY